MQVLDWIAVAGYFVVLIVVGVQTMKKSRMPMISRLPAIVLSGRSSSAASLLPFWAAAHRWVSPGRRCATGTSTCSPSAPSESRPYWWDSSSRPSSNATAVHTLGDVMHAHYGKPARVITGGLSIVLCTGILGAQALAIGTVVNATLDVPPTLAIILGMGVTVLYSAFGGAWAVIQTDLLQFVFLGVLIPVTLLIGLHAVGGPSALVDALPSDHLTLMGDYSVMKFVGLFAALLLGETLVPPYAQRTFSTPDSSHARKGFVTAGIFSFFFFFISASIGAVAFVLYPDIEPDSALPTVVTNLMPIGLLGLLVAALLAVVMSTASSYINSSAVVFTDDLYRPLAKHEASQRKRLNIERTLSVVVGAGATIFALTVPSIVDALLYSYTLWAPTMIVPLFGAVLFGVRSAPAALWGISAGAAVTVVWQWVLMSPFGLDGLLPGVAANFIAYTVAAVATSKKYPRRTQTSNEPILDNTGAH